MLNRRARPPSAAPVDLDSRSSSSVGHRQSAKQRTYGIESSAWGESEIGFEQRIDLNSRHKFSCPKNFVCFIVCLVVTRRLGGISEIRSSINSINVVRKSRASSNPFVNLAGSYLLFVVRDPASEPFIVVTRSMKFDALIERRCYTIFDELLELAPAHGTETPSCGLSKYFNSWRRDRFVLGS